MNTMEKQEEERKAQEIHKFEQLLYAINNCDGVRIDYNIIKKCLVPLKEYLEKEIKQWEEGE